MKRDLTRPQEDERTPAGGVVKHVVLNTLLGPAVNLRKAAHKMLRARIGTAARLFVSDWILKWRHKHRPGRKTKMDHSEVQNYVGNWMRRAGNKWGDRKRAVRAAGSRFGVSKRTIENALKRTKTDPRSND